VVARRDFGLQPSRLNFPVTGNELSAPKICPADGSHKNKIPPHPRWIDWTLLIVGEIVAIATLYAPFLAEINHK
jgi:hypothetical protein